MQRLDVTSRAQAIYSSIDIVGYSSRHKSCPACLRVIGMTNLSGTVLTVVIGTACLCDRLKASSP